MDLVTITDHDSIDGCLEFLERHPDATDFVIGEEVECRLPDDDLIVHVGVLGLDERVHREIQTLRDDVFALAAYLSEERLPFALNHPLMFYEESADFSRYVRELVSMFPGIEYLTSLERMTQDPNPLRSATWWVRATRNSR